MSRLTRFIAAAMLAFWGLAISHCDLEQLPGLEFLACCQHAEAAPHQDNDCEQDGCSVVESGFYKVEEQTLSIPAPLVVVKAQVLASEISDPTLSLQSDVLTSLPPELPRMWHFLFRAAQPPRAPSFDS